jgi:hypothetical protein
MLSLPFQLLSEEHSSTVLLHINIHLVLAFIVTYMVYIFFSLKNYKTVFLSYITFPQWKW